MSDGAVSELDDPRDQSGRVAKNIASVAGSQAVTWLFSAVALVIVPRALGPTAIGQLGFAVAIWQLAKIVVSFGSSQLIVREMSQDPDEGSRVMSTVLPMQWISWCVVAVGVLAYAALTSTDGTVLTLLIITGVLTLLVQTGQTFRSGVIGRERLALSSSVAVIERALVAILTVVVVLLDRGVEEVASVGLIGAVVTLVVLVAVIRRDDAISLRLSLRERRSVLERAIPLMLLGSALLLYREIDVLALKALADDEAVGLYTATDRLFGAMVMVPSAISVALFPTLSRRFTTDPEGVYDTVRRLCGFLAVLTFPIAVGAWMLGPELALSVLGSEFEKSGDVMRVYGVVLVPVGWTVVLGMLCTVSRRERVWTAVLLASAAATIPLDIVLVPFSESRFDNAALAGAIAFAVTETCAAAFGFWKILPRAVDRAFVSTMARSLVAAGAMALVLDWLDHLHLVIKVPIGGLVYAVVAFGVGALKLDDFASLGGPFARLARFRRRRSDLDPENVPQSATSASEFE